MSLTRAEAIDAMTGLLKTAWDATDYAGRLKYENVAEDDEDFEGNDPWARLTIRHNLSSQATLSNQDGQRRFRRLGVLIIQVFTPQGTGLFLEDDLPTVVRDAYEGKSVLGGLIFRDVTINEIGTSGSWFQTNVTASFEYDEVK